VKENFACGVEEVAGADAFDDGSPALVVEGDAIEFEVVYGELRVGFVVGPLGVGVALRRA
jgi:hypothetical protein